MEQAHNSAILEQPLSTPDQAAFDRVWNRVMARSGQEAEQIYSAPPAPPGPSGLPAPAVPQQRSAPPARADTVPPAQYDLPCLGAASAQYVPLLREMLDGCSSTCGAYRAAGRQAQGAAARQLWAMSEDQQRAARQLGTAYFLITGERFVLSDPVHLHVRALSRALRDLFMQEQRWRQAYAQAAEQTSDPCLTQLFTELSDRAALHMDTIRRILEGM